MDQLDQQRRVEQEAREHIISLQFLSLQPCVSVQTSDNVLQNQELTAAVLSHLDSFQEIIACSAVSKCWLATVSNLAPTSLVIPGPNAKLTLTATHHTLYWVKQKHSNGRFQNLHFLLTA